MKKGRTMKKLSNFELDCPNDGVNLQVHGLPK